MYAINSQAQWERHVGKWVRFRTPWGRHQGLVERITDKEVIIVAPKRYVPAQFATDITPEEMSKVDAVLADWRGTRLASGIYPYGHGGYGGWARWAVSFLVIYLLFGLAFWW